KNFFRVNDQVIDELTQKLRQTPERGEQRSIAKRIVDREYDQALRLWMPYDTGYQLFQPYLRNMAGGGRRRTVCYGSPPIARPPPRQVAPHGGGRPWAGPTPDLTMRRR